MEALSAAAHAGDFEALLSVLDPEVALRADRADTISPADTVCRSPGFGAPKGRSNEAQANGLGQQNLHQIRALKGRNNPIQSHTYRSS